MDVMIIPPPRLGGIYEDNRIWPAQWQAADPANRRLVPLEKCHSASRSGRNPDCRASGGYYGQCDLCGTARRHGRIGP